MVGIVFCLLSKQRIMKNALENPDFAAICGAKTYTAEYGDPPYRRRITNHNKLLSTLDGATGVKTGFTKKAGRCLVSSAEREGVSLICVTLCCFPLSEACLL